MKKHCPKCDKTKPVGEFYGRKRHTKSGIRMSATHMCQDCIRTYNRNRYQPKYKIREAL